MDAEIRLQQVTAHHQQLRDEAAANRLARSGHNASSAWQPRGRIPRAIGDLRGLVRSLA